MWTQIASLGIGFAAGWTGSGIQKGLGVKKLVQLHKPGE